MTWTRVPFHPRGDAHGYPASRMGATPCFTAFSTSGCSRNGGTITPRAGVVDLVGDRQPRAEADALDVEIGADEIQLALERRPAARRSDRRRPFIKSDSRTTIVARKRRIDVDQREQRVERVEDEVRLELRLSAISIRRRAPRRDQRALPAAPARARAAGPARVSVTLSAVP